MYLILSACACIRFGQEWFNKYEEAKNIFFIIFSLGLNPCFVLKAFIADIILFS